MLVKHNILFGQLIGQAYKQATIKHSARPVNVSHGISSCGVKQSADFIGESMDWCKTFLYAFREWALFFAVQQSRYFCRTWDKRRNGWGELASVGLKNVQLSQLGYRWIDLRRKHLAVAKLYWYIDNAYRTDENRCFLNISLWKFLFRTKLHWNRVYLFTKKLCQSLFWDKGSKDGKHCRRFFNWLECYHHNI